MKSEEGVIHCLLMGGNFNEIAFLKAFMFEDLCLARIYEAFEKPDACFVTIWDNPPTVEGMTEADVKQRITEIAKAHYDEMGRSIYDTAHMGRYAASVCEAYRKRRFQAIMSKYSDSSGDDNIIGEMRAEIDELLELTALRVGNSAADLVEKYKNDYPKEADKCGIRFGIDSEIDRLLGGIEAGDLCFIGARPAVGKSAFALQVAKNLVRGGLKVGVFSLEMQERSIYERLLAAESDIPLTLIRSGKSIDKGKLEQGNDKISELKTLYIYSGSFTVGEITQAVKRDKLQVVIVDYLQLVKPDDRYKGVRVSEVGAISHGLKALAMKENIPIIPLVQLNRDIEKREDKEPKMSDIRESGDIEQDASQITFLWDVPGDEIKNSKGFTIAKNRNGELGRVYLAYNGAKMRFISLDSFKPVPDDEPLVFA